MFNFWITALTLFANLLLGFIVYKRNSKSITHKVFGFLTLDISLWAILNYLSLVAVDPSIIILWIRAVMVSVAIMFPAIYVLARVFPYKEAKLSSLEIVSIVISTIFTSVLSVTPLVFDHVQLLPSGTTPVPGVAIPLFGLHVIIYLLLTVITLFIKRSKAEKVYKPQIKLMLIGLGLTFILSFLTTFIFVVILHNSNFVIFGPAYTLFLIGCIAYAIARHKFLDITSLVARAISYTFVLATVVLLEVGILWLGTRLLPTTIDRTIIAFAGSILIVMSFTTLSIFITKLTDKIFFQGRYDEEDLLKSLTSVMVSEMNVKFLELKLTKMLCQEMKVSYSSFLLVTDFIAKKVPTLDEANLPNIKYAILEKMLHSVKNTMIFEELTDELDKEVFRKLEISVILPLKVGDEDIGLFILGPKLSGDIYVDRDIRFLEIFAPQAAIALKNADSYRQIQEFSQTLELKVIDRTHELEEAQKEQLKLKDEFVFIATHDLATPVTAISGFSALIKARKDNLPEAVVKDLSAIDEAANRLKVLVNDLLQVARSDSGTIKVNLVKVDAKETLESAVREITPLAKEKGVTIKLVLSSINSIQADPVKLAEIFENLLSNGVKYNKPGGSLTITSTIRNGQVFFEFKDTGVGIDESEQSKVFTKFFRSETPEVRQRPGTGLGLFVVRMLAEKMGGTISFESIKDVGSTFTLQFNS